MRRRERWIAPTVLALLLLAILTVTGWTQDQQSQSGQPSQQGQPSALKVPTIWHNDALWVAVRDAAKALDFEFQYQPQSQKVEATRGDKHATASVPGGAWMSGDQRLFVPATWLRGLGYEVRPNPKAHRAVVAWDGQEGSLAPGPRSIAVNLNRQVLLAREGEVVVYRFRVSTGKLGYDTPDGDYKVLRKEAMHISTLYPEPTGGAKMPYSLWFDSGYYIHGYQSVPHHPASHGCIRVSIPNAKTLFDWTPVGTPVRIYRTTAE